MLTAYDPARLTVMDTRALQSLTALGRWSEDQGPGASCLTWLAYLETCRELTAADPLPTDLRAALDPILGRPAAY
jgi:hypothetical protein